METTEALDERGGSPPGASAPEAAVGVAVGDRTTATGSAPALKLNDADFFSALEAGTSGKAEVHEGQIRPSVTWRSEDDDDERSVPPPPPPPGERFSPPPSEADRLRRILKVASLAVGILAVVVVALGVALTIVAANEGGEVEAADAPSAAAPSAPTTDDDYFWTALDESGPPSLVDEVPAQDGSAGALPPVEDESRDEGPAPAPESYPTSVEPSGGPTAHPTPEPSRAPVEAPTASPTTAAPTRNPATGSPTEPPTSTEPYFFGEEFITNEELDVQVSKGLIVRVLARTGEPVPYADGTESTLTYHAESDAAGVISMDPDDPRNGGYVYVVNSEDDGGKGGVYGIYFDEDGNVLEYKALLTGTTWNCGGGLISERSRDRRPRRAFGWLWRTRSMRAAVRRRVNTSCALAFVPNWTCSFLASPHKRCRRRFAARSPGHTPWNTWISCEEFEHGQCWEIDPVLNRTALTVLGGDGGEYESVACDDRDPSNLVFYVTEDDEKGALRRFETPRSGWGALHDDANGTTTYLRVLDDGEYEWTTDEDEARKSAKEHYPNAEGVQFHEGKLYFMSKELRTMLVLDVDGNTYESEVAGKKFYGEGDYGDQPDQNVLGPTRKYMYFTEDGGESPGVYARYDGDGTYFALFQGVPGGRYDGDETVGIALSPDHRTLYAGFQEFGIIFEIKREDGLAFE
ncbi:hypothetical protein ACHAWF_015523 [Thalassiosira exigua]